VDGPAIIATTLSEVRPFGRSRARYQYHPRSDHHSKVTCWAIAYDLLHTSALLRQHVADGKVTIGINHRMADFRLQKPKNLDLVVARPALPQDSTTRGVTLDELRKRYGIQLTPAQRKRFDALPTVHAAPVGSVLMALEAKACMTAHGKSGPRLSDELNSSQQTIHGAADHAVAVGLAMVNIAPHFISPIRNQTPGAEPIFTQHHQPDDAAGVIAVWLRKVHRRTTPGQDGFDAFGIIVVDLANDATPVTVRTTAPAPGADDDDTYQAMVLRAASLYDYRFNAI
jgi:hypothetical protein